MWIFSIQTNSFPYWNGQWRWWMVKSIFLYLKTMMLNIKCASIQHAVTLNGTLKSYPIWLLVGWLISRRNIQWNPLVFPFLSVSLSMFTHSHFRSLSCVPFFNFESHATCLCWILFYGQITYYSDFLDLRTTNQNNRNLLMRKSNIRRRRNTKFHQLFVALKDMWNAFIICLLSNVRSITEYK